MPRISVVMSVYNGEKYLRQAIESILQQTYTDFEFIIIDDGSTDSSREIIQSYDDKRIRLVINEQNIGLTKSLNKGIRLAKGEFIARMDADDISLPQRFEKQVAYLDSHPEVGVLGTYANIIDHRGKIINNIIFPTEHETILWTMLLFY
jgi:glycosyltransferase involved in cell wall biosynthesis